MLAVIVGNIRMIALPTLVTLLVPADRRDKANGLVGMVGGIGFLTTSAISGFLVAWGGMAGTLIFAIGLSLVVIAHLLFIHDRKSVVSGKSGSVRVDLGGRRII